MGSHLIKIIINLFLNGFFVFYGKPKKISLNFQVYEVITIQYLILAINESFPSITVNCYTYLVSGPDICI